LKDTIGSDFHGNHIGG